MSIQEFFVDDVTRPIETVIKADDEEHILQEMSEYVITREIAKKITSFFEVYNDYEGANGVWISGFFGSGKSHLLKILSYVLEDKKVEGEQLGKIFANKIDDELLKGDVEAATRIPSESVLFNIDQKADITSKSQEDAILQVFYKVFNDHLGYFGRQGHVAQFERMLDQQGHYEEFKEEFEKHYDKPWVEARRTYVLPKVKEAIGQAYGKIQNDDPEKYEGIIDEMRKDYKISIEDFCEHVKAYIDSKPEGFRLNFFVDEVGQYISDDTKLMLNLQTVAETLETKTRGKSWILVTSQEDMDKVVGDLKASQRNDFSRIQARFKNKISLTSANVDEVIEKRLLSKTEEAESTLSSIWQKEEANLETILRFQEGIQFRRYMGEQDFSNKYPFIPYQFSLFQECMDELSEHSAFQGKHQSIGERSMLGAFQEVLKSLNSKEFGYFVSFDKLFDGIRSVIRSRLQSAINLAEKHLQNDFAVRVLKALFMVKYYRQFKPTLNNVSILMIDDINIDLKQHKEKVKEALNILETQTYIQRNGEVYEFLTNEEKDIEKEIKNTPIDNTEITKLFGEIIYDDIINENSLKYEGNNQSYHFTKRIDGAPQGREYDLDIDIITPNHAHHGDTDILQNQAMGYNTKLTLVLSAHERLIKDVNLYLKTERYKKQNQSSDNSAIVTRILSEKEQKNRDRKQSLRQLMDRLLGEATVFTGSGKMETSNPKSGKQKVAKAFQQLVKTAYPNLKMLGDINYTQTTVKQILSGDTDGLFEADDDSMSEAEQDMLSTIKRRKKQSDRTTVKDLLDHYQKKPYGWYPEAIFSIAARLVKRGKVEVRKDGNLLDDEQTKDALLNSSLHNNVLFEPQAEFSSSDVLLLKEIYNDAFNEPVSANEAKEVALSFKEQLQQEIRNIDNMLQRKPQYPFLKELEDVQEIYRTLAEKEYSWLIQNVKEFEDKLLDAKEDYWDPIRQFIHGQQSNIFDTIRQYVKRDNSNVRFIEGNEYERLKEIFNDPAPYRGELMIEANKKIESLKEKLQVKLKEERSKAQSVIDNTLYRLRNHEDFDELSDQQQELLLEPINREDESLSHTHFINEMQAIASKVKNELQPNALSKLANWASENRSKDGKAADKKVGYVPLRRVQVNDFSKTELQSDEDVDAYCEALNKKLKQMLKDNKRINL
jgi:hypothetical protein